RRSPHHPGVPQLGRRPVALPFGPRPDRPARPRHPGVHRPGERPDDPAHARPEAGAGGPEHLQRLLVLGPPVGGRPLARPARGVRPDWDLSTPGLREAWDAGDVSAFHGWNKWSPERVAAERARLHVGGAT